MKRFDAEMRGKGRWANWERPPHRYVIVYNGQHYPVKEVISLATGLGTESFSGGDESNDYLDRRGFTVIPIEHEQYPDDLAPLKANLVRESSESVDQFEHGSDLRTLFEQVLSGGSGDATEIGAPIAGLYKLLHAAAGRLKVSALLNSKPYLQVDIGAGMGRPAEIPWITIRDERIAASTREGVHIALLFRADRSGLCLTIEQGVGSDANRKPRNSDRVKLRTGADRLREHFRNLDSRFRLEGDADLRAESMRGRAYEAATIGFTCYERGAIPPEHQLLEDVAEAIRVYEEFADGLIGAPAATPASSADILDRRAAAGQPEAKRARGLAAEGRANRKPVRSKRTPRAGRGHETSPYVVSGLTQSQVEELARSYRMTPEVVITVAVDRMYREMGTQASKREHFALNADSEDPLSNDAKSNEWREAVLECVRRVPSRRFTDDDILASTDDLQSRFPEKSRISAAIRKTLNELCNEGFIARAGEGKYEKVR